MAHEVAKALQVHQELAMGPLPVGGIRFLNQETLRAYPIDQASFDAVVARETREWLRREQMYRGSRPALQLKDQVVILVDDGLATGKGESIGGSAAEGDLGV